MYRAHIDTPWAISAEGVNVPKLAIDPAFGSLLLSRKDITGAEGAVVDIGGGVMRHLYGGNYNRDDIPRVQPDYSVGRLGGSGDPNWMSIETTVEDQQTLMDIDSDSSYWVYWSEEIIEEEQPVAAAAPYKPENLAPSQAEFGQLRARLAQRGIPQAWINLILGGSGNPSKTRGEYDIDMRAGYLLYQYDPGGATVIDIPPLVTALAGEGWNAAVVLDHLLVVRDTDPPDNIWISEAELLDCAAHATNTPAPLWNDIHDYVTSAGYCL